MRRVLPASALVLAACGGWTPTATVEDLAVTRFDFEQVTVGARVRVDNPWPVGVTVRRYTYAVEVEGHALVAGEAADGVVVPGRGSVAFDVPATVGWSELRAIVGPAEAEVPWALDADLVVATPIGDRSVPVRVGGTLPVLEPPAIGVDAVRFGRNDVGLGLAVDLRLRTERPLAYAVEEARWALTIDDRPLAGGLVRAHVDGADVILTLEAGVEPSAGWAGARRLWAGEEVVGAFVVDATVRTPLGAAPFGARLEHALVWE